MYYSLVGDILEAKYLQLSSCFYATDRGVARGGARGARAPPTSLSQVYKSQRLSS